MANPDESPLSDGDLALVGLLAQGLTHERAGAALGVSSKTVQRRCRVPAFAAAVADARRARVNELTGALVTASSRAVEVLTETLDGDDPRSAVTAARVILDHGFRFQRSQADDAIKERLDQLEALLAGRGEDGGHT
jgi:hypothetical protein